MNLNELREALPAEGFSAGYAELRISGKDGKTISILIQPDSLSLANNGVLTVSAAVRAANIANGVDSRIDTQRKSIERLLEHLKFHCPDLAPDGPIGTTCRHLREESAS